MRPRARAQQREKPPQREACTPQLESSSRAAHLNAREAVQDPAQQKRGQKVKHLCTIYQESTHRHCAMFASDISF